jgi:colicin import membrane protein
LNATVARPAALRRWHAPERSAPAFGLSLLVHGALFIAIAFAVRWKTAEPAGAVSVELWGGLPAAAPPAVVPPPPPPAVVPAPPPPPAEKPAEIIERKAEPPKKKVEPPKPEPKKVELPTKKGPTPEELKRDAEARAAADARERALNRALAQAGGAPGPASAAASGGFARGYESLVVGCIRPYIVFTVPEGVRAGQHVAEFDVQLAPTGEQLGAPRLVRASGLAQYDAAVERAIRRCDPFPRPREGTMPRSLRLAFDPVETR